MPRLPVGHRAEMAAALAHDGEAQRHALAGDWGPASRAFRAAAVRYRASWELAPPGGYGRLVGMLKAAILAGDGSDEARFAAEQLASAPDDSPTAAYGKALSALVLGEDEAAARSAAVMRSGSEAFARASAAITALVQRDSRAYAAALEAIVRDFESRGQHLTGVAIADTAVVFERLAARRGLESGVASPLLPTPAATGSSDPVLESREPSDAID